MDYTRLLNALPQAKAAYGDDSSNGPVSVGTWQITPITEFDPKTTNFQAGFYKDSQTGQYRIGFAGSNDTQDWTRANANLTIGSWTPEATDSIRFVGAALVQIRQEILLNDDTADVSLSILLSKLDTTVGHSQGGAWAELNRSFWGGNAVNIDGPGVGALLNKPEFAQLKAEMQKEFPDLASEAFTANDGSLQAYAFSKIGLTGDHVGTTVQATVDAKVVDFLTDLPVPPLLGQQAALGGLHTALSHRIDAIETQAKEGALAETNQQIEDVFNKADELATDIKAKYPDTTQVAGSGDDLPEDLGIHAAPAIAPNTFNNYLDSQGTQLNPAQQQALATQIDKLGLGGEGDLSFYSLPGGGALIANADGDIVGEINRNSATGDLQLKATAIDANGNPVEVNNHIGEQGQVLSDAAVVQAQASNMFNSLMAVNNWGHMNDLGKLSALVNLYNATDKLGEAFGATGDNLPGDLGAAAGYLQLAQGLQSGDNLVIANGINVVSDHALDNAMNNAMGTTAEGAAVPYLSYALAMRNFADNPEQAALTMAGTYVGEAIGMAIGGPIGSAIGGAIGGMIGGTIGGMFGDDDIPMREGLAHAQWDANGHTQVVTTQDAEGGGATANSWMSSLVSGLQASLDHTVDANGHAQYSLVPNLLPSVGFKYDPDGYNLANGARGFMYLEWTDEAGQSQTRYYDGAGNRGDGSGETLSGDFVQHAQGAIAPAWQVQTTLAHYQQSGEIDLPAQTKSLPTELADGLHQTLQVISLELSSALPAEATTTTTTKLIDVDGDGYLEQTQWLQTNQALLAVDLNGDGQIGLGETLNLQDADQVQHARTSMGWLDANSDGKLTAQDPAFAALKLWVDVNADGKSANGELQTLSQAGITAIDFSTHPPSIERADGSQQALTVQTLTADTLGVALQQTTGGVLETREQQDGSGTRVLYAVNTRAFDGQADSTHGGDKDVDGSNGDVVQLDASKLATTTHNTQANSSTQATTTVGVGDSRLKSAAGTTATVSLTATNSSTTVGTTATNNASVVFVPAGQTSAQREIQLVTDNMIESSQSLLFGGGSASEVANSLSAIAEDTALHIDYMVKQDLPYLRTLLELRNFPGNPERSEVLRSQSGKDSSNCLSNLKADKSKWGASCNKVTIVGTRMPRSSMETYVRSIPALRAKLSCDKPAARRALRSSSPKRVAMLARSIFCTPQGSN